MKISTYQFNPFYGSCHKNLEILKTKAQEIQSDVIVFPELALSGYSFVTKDQTAVLGEEYIRLQAYSQLSAIAKKYNKIIVYGFPEKVTDDEIYNAAQVCFPKPEYDYVYRKTHLFYKERYAFNEGNSGFKVVYYPDFDLHLGTMICYDWRFPESARTLAMNGADLIVCPANLVTDLWTKVMPARAIENKVFFAVANRCGSECANGEELIFKGLSAIYSFNGDVLDSASPDQTEVISAEFNPELTRDKSFNPINDIFKDRRPQFYVD